MRDSNHITDRPNSSADILLFTLSSCIQLLFMVDFFIAQYLFTNQKEGFYVNDFERKIADEYVMHHAVPLLHETAELSKLMEDVADPAQFLEQQMSIASINRFVYIALRAYHDSLAHNLLERGISLPDFDTLVSNPDAHD